jgi:MarR family transcriptional regulator, 2-MHQ and catechol-resistance regulon repressor
VDQVPSPAVAATPDDASIDEISGAFRIVLASQRRMMAKVWRDRSISKLNLHLLMLLEARESQSMSELAEQAGVTLPNLTGTITRMEELGLVKRVPCREDRRKVLVRLAAKGRTVLAQIESIRRAEIRRLLRRLSPIEQEMCRTAMRALARAALEPEPEPD